MIITEGVTKYFGRFQALKNISFRIEKGEIVGLLGQNGAGKTTLMRLITSYLLPSSGRIVVGGTDLRKDSLTARRKIGYLPEVPPLYPSMTVRDYLSYAAELKDIPVRQLRLCVDRALEECQIKDVQQQEIGVLSRGYRQRVGLAQAIINDPQVLILDEPTNGLDPVQVQQVRGLIKNLEHKRTVILSTHILSEIEEIAKRVMIIKSGEMMADEPLISLLQNKQTTKRLFVKIRGYGPLIDYAIRGTKNMKLIQIVSEETLHEVELEMEQDTLHYNELIENILKANGQILEMYEDKLHLEDVFLKLVSPAGPR